MSPITHQVSKHSLVTIVDEITTHMLGREARADPEGSLPSFECSDCWTALVDVGLPHEMVVRVSCPHRVALDAAERMLGDANDTLAAEVLGEITSMVAGNVKSLIVALHGAPLGTPRLVRGPARRPSLDAMVWASIDLDGAHFTVSLHPPEHHPSIAPAEA